VNRFHALAVLAVGVVLLGIDVLRAPKKPAHDGDAAPAGAPEVDAVDDNGQHDDEDGCGHDDGAVDDDDIQGAGDDEDDPAQD
jgi:hypothetical protein